MDQHANSFILDKHHANSFNLDKHHETKSKEGALKIISRKKTKACISRNILFSLVKFS